MILIAIAIVLVAALILYFVFEDERLAGHDWRDGDE